MVAPEARVQEVLADAACRMFAGQVADTEALNLAVSLGWVRFTYEGVGGFLGLAKLQLTDAGREPALSPQSEDLKS